MSGNDKCPKCGAEQRRSFPVGGEPHDTTTVFVCGAWVKNDEVCDSFVTCLRRQLQQAQAERDEMLHFFQLLQPPGSPPPFPPVELCRWIMQQVVTEREKAQAELAAMTKERDAWRFATGLAELGPDAAGDKIDETFDALSGCRDKVERLEGIVARAREALQSIHGHFSTHPANVGRAYAILAESASAPPIEGNTNKEI